MPYDAFISYKSEDLAKAELIAAALADSGLKVWFDKARLQPGCDWHAEIEAGCESSRVVLPVLTPRWRESEWTRFETYGAEFVIPLHCEGAWADVITPPLERFQAERMDASDLRHMNWSVLVQAIRRACERPEPQHAPRTAHLRYRPNPYFVGREKDLNAIHEELHRNPKAVLTQGRVRAIAAMGGVGKTTLARHYAEKFWRCYQQMFWVDCRHVMESEFANIYDLLFPSFQHTGLSPAEKASKALQELSGPVPRLLILDNAEDEKTVQDWIPKTGGCHTLLTSRFAGWSAAIKSMHLYLLDHGPAMQLLERRVGRPMNDADHQTAEVLVQKLGYLPLAIEQAAAYIEQQGDGFGFADYLRLFEKATADLLAADSLCSTEYPDPVITTWKSTIAKLSQGARAILQLMSFMSAAPLPAQLLIDGAASVRRAAALCGEDRATAMNDEVWIRKELGCLKGYSMVESDGPYVSVHPLVQVVERLNMSADLQRRTIELAMSCFASHAPIDIHRYEMLILWRHLVPHAEEMKRNAELHSGLDIHPRILTGLSYVYYDQHRMRDAIRLGCLALRALRKETGDADKDTLRCMQKLGNMLDKKGRGAAAERLLRQAAAGLQTVDGPEGSLTLSALNDLANVLANRGKHEEAREHYAKCLEVHDRFLGSLRKDALDAEIVRGQGSTEHNPAWKALSGRMKAYNGLGSVACDLDDAVEAERLLRLAVADAHRVLGPKHPETAAAYAWLSSALFKQQRYIEAIDWRHRAHQVYESILGPDHHSTTDALFMLAFYTFLSGDVRRATEYFKRLHVAWLKGGGKELGEAAGVMGQIADALERAGRWSESAAYRQFEYDLRRKIGNVEDPATVRSLDKLMQLARLRGDADTFAQLAREWVGTLEAAHGPAASQTLAAINQLAKHLEETGKIDAAESEYLKGLEREPRDVVLLGNYAFLRQNIRADFSGARDLYLRALQADPSDAINQTNFAGLCLVAGEHAEAEKRLREARRLAGGRADCYACRTFFLRAALAAVRKEDANLYLGQLKTTFDLEIRPMPSRNTTVRDYLQQQLAAGAFALFDAIYAAINEPDGLAKLKAMPAWQQVKAVALDVAW